MRRSQRGFGYLLLLFALAVFGVALAQLGEVATTTAKRERETELLFIGEQFAQALASYQARSPAGEAPTRLEELVEDKRFPFIVRHLRRIYPDPMTGEPDWEIKLVGGRIAGIHSRSKESPLRLKPPDFVSVESGGGEDDFGAAQPGYADWVFTPKQTTAGATGSPAQGGAANAANTTAATTGAATGSASTTPAATSTPQP